MHKPSAIFSFLILPGALLLVLLSLGSFSYATFTMLLTGLMFFSIFKEVSQPSVCAGGSFIFLLIGSAIHGKQRGLDLETIVIQKKALLSGFSSPTLITVGALFIVAEGVRASGWLEYASQKILNNETNEKKQNKTNETTQSKRNKTKQQKQKQSKIKKQNKTKLKGS